MKTIVQKLGFLILLLGFVHFAEAQFTASGTILDPAGEPLIGASVQVKGSSLGTITDIDGNWSLDITSDKATLVVSYVGYDAKEVEISAASPVLSITLDDSATTLSEVIVTGYGSTRKEALTGAVTSLRSDKIEQVPLASVGQALQGNIAGLQAVSGNGQPGAMVQIRIRGQGSLSASSEPLFVVDGIPIYNPGDGITNNSESANTLATINPNDIESVSVLKDASATAIYGARAANGVILITTKSGKAGKAKIKFSAQYGFNDWAIKDKNQYRGLSALEYVDLYIDGHMNRGRSLENAIDRFNNDFPDPFSGKPAVDITQTGDNTYTTGEVRVDTRWVEEITRVGQNQSYDLSASGGNETFTYFASGAYFEQESPIIGTGLDRYSSRLSIQAKASKRLKFSNNIYLSQTHQTGPDDATAWSNPMYNAYLLAPTIPVRNPQGQFYAAHKSFFMGGNNPVGALSGDDDLEWTMVNVSDALSADYEILDGLTFRSAWAVNLLSYREFYFRNSRYGDGRNSGGFGEETSRSVVDWIGTQTLSYNKTFADNHNADIIVGYEANKHTNRSSIASGEQYPPNSQLRTIQNAAGPYSGSSWESAYSFQSVFSRLSYNYQYKYYLQGSLRRDGSSRFGADNQFGTFWSLGASWRLDQEEFINNIGFINELKLRTSYGVTGNAGIGNFDHLSTVAFGIDYDGNPGGAIDNVGNQNLTWEENKSFNIGVDFRIFDRVSGTIEYFNRESDNLLLNLPVSRTTGFTSATLNFGAMENKGLELTIDADIISTPDFNWSIGGNISFIQNEVTRLDEPFVSGTHDRFFIQEGYNYNEYHMYEFAGVNPDDGKALFYVDETRSETTDDPSEAERFYIGKQGTPKQFGGAFTSLSYKGFSVDAQFVFALGHWIYDGTAWVAQGDGRFTPRSNYDTVLDRWRQPGDETDVPYFRWGGNSGSNTQGTTRYLHDGTHIRLRNLTVAYQLPQEWVNKTGFSSTRVYFRGVNIWTWTKDKDLHYDPETAIRGYMESTIPNLKTFSFGIDFGF